jgi:hypothetical protein
MNVFSSFCWLAFSATTVIKRRQFTDCYVAARRSLNCDLRNTNIAASKEEQFTIGLNMFVLKAARNVYVHASNKGVAESTACVATN